MDDWITNPGRKDKVTVNGHVMMNSSMLKKEIMEMRQQITSGSFINPACSPSVSRSNIVQSVTFLTLNNR